VQLEEGQTKVFCGQCGSPLVVDEEVQKIEYTHKGEVTHRLEGVEKIDELASHIKMAGGGSQLSRAESLASAGFMALQTGDYDKADKKFEEAIDCYSECRIALLGKGITCKDFDDSPYVNEIQEGKITESEKQLIKKYSRSMANLLLCYFSWRDLSEHLDYLLSVLDDSEKKTYLNRIHKDNEATLQHGMTPLVEALGWGHRDIVKKLIAAGADVNFADGNGITPLGGCVPRTDKYEIDLDDMTMLLQHGADLDKLGRHIAREAGADGTLHVTPAQGLIARGEVNYVKKLLEQRLIDPNKVVNGMNYFMFSIWYVQPAMADILCKHGANVLRPYNDSLFSHAGVKYAWTPLFRAVQQKEEELVRVLCQNISKKDKLVKTYIPYAKSASTKPIVKLLKAALKNK
jgi:hypothetical protein